MGEVSGASRPLDASRTNIFLQQLGERWAPQDTNQTVKKIFTVVDHLRLRGAVRK